jgi:glycosyltransferase involved in cell wall biosynthesis
VPVYGVERYIERCARSLFEQTYLYLDYVFVNDCTPDNSIELLKKVLSDYPIRMPFVKIVNHTQNRGLAAARNTALDYASGDFVFMVDSDDWLEKDAISRLVERQHKTGADIVSGGYCEVFDNRIAKFIYPDTVAFGRRKIVQMVMDGDIGFTMCGRIIRRSLFVDNSFRWIEGNNMAEDLRAIIMLSYLAKSMSSIDDVVFFYDKRNENSIMHANNNPYKVLKNYKESFWNVVSVLEFFYGKEKDYYEKAVEMTIMALEQALRYTLKCSDKKGFYELMLWLDSHEDCMNAMGYKKQGIKSCVLHNYHFMRLDYQKERVKRFLERKLKKF